MLCSASSFTFPKTITLCESLEERLDQQTTLLLCQLYSPRSEGLFSPRGERQADDDCKKQISEGFVSVGEVVQHSSWGIIIILLCRNKVPFISEKGMGTGERAVSYCRIISPQQLFQAVFPFALNIALEKDPQPRPCGGRRWDCLIPKRHLSASTRSCRKKRRCTLLAVPRTYGQPRAAVPPVLRTIPLCTIPQRDV